jgi:hypothetical protein
LQNNLATKKKNFQNAHLGQMGGGSLAPAAIAASGSPVPNN